MKLYGHNEILIVNCYHEIREIGDSRENQGIVFILSYGNENENSRDQL